MSLNDTYEALNVLASELRTFDESLRSSHAEVQRLHGNIDGIWRDSLRIEYDRLMGDFERKLASYAGNHSERFERFLSAKLSQLHSYLYGR